MFWQGFLNHSESRNYEASTQLQLSIAVATRGKLPQQEISGATRSKLLRQSWNYPVVKKQKAKKQKGKKAKSKKQKSKNQKSKKAKKQNNKKQTKPIFL